jgi:DNA-binding beta-propeller fold protein YncE
MVPFNRPPAAGRELPLFICAAALIIGTAAGAAQKKPIPLPSVIYHAPADRAPAGPLAHQSQVTILPSGRFVTPSGATMRLPSGTGNVVLTPGGKYALVVASDARSSSISVVDTASMNVVSTYTSSGAPFSGGIAITNDVRHRGERRYLVLASEGAANSVAALNLSGDGQLTADDVPAIALGNPQTANATSRHFVGNIVANAQRAFVVDELGREVWAIDLPERSLMGHVSVGFAPHAIDLRGKSLLVSNEGIGDSRPLPHDRENASSLSVVKLGQHGDLRGDPVSSIELDQTPGGAIAGGAHPSAIVQDAHGTALIAMAGIDRIASVSLKAGRISGGSEMRLFDHGPLGTKPVAMAYDAVRQHLYVALSGIDAIAVVDVHDALRPHRLGLIPTGNRPSSVVLSPNRRFLYVASLRGRGQAGMLERIELENVHLPTTTARTLMNLRRIEVPKANSQTSVISRVGPHIRTVIQIRMPAATFDEIFSVRDQRFGVGVMPNVHRLAQRYTLFSNLYAQSDLPLEGVATALGGQASAYAIRTALAGSGRRPAGNPNALTPNDASRYGLVFDQLRTRGMNYQILSDCRDSAVPCVRRFTGRLDEALAEKRQPSFIAVALPDPVTREQGAIPVDAASIAKDDDAALGELISHLAKTRLWKSSVIVISPWRAGDGSDHVNQDRIYGIVISPFSASSHVDGHHRTLQGFLKTEEELLHLQPLSLGELLSNDFGEIFSVKIH